MDYQEAKRLLHPDTTRDAIWEIADKQEAIKKINEACVIACDAIDELRELHDQGFSLDRMKDIDFRKEVVEHINYDAYMSMQDELEEYKQLGTLEEVMESIRELKMYKDCKLCLVPEDVYGKQCEELDRYKELGTLEEVREAVEKQKAKKSIDVRGDKLKFCTCPSCGRRITNVEGGNYCQNCGQALDWSEANG